MKKLDTEIFNNEEKIKEIKELLKNCEPDQANYVVFKFFDLFSKNKRDIIDYFGDDVDKIYKTYILASIVSMFKKEAQEKRKIIEEQTDSLENYKEILKKYKILAQELNLTNSLEIANLYTYLLWNGYFSKDKKLKYQTHDRLLIPGMFSHDIMDGVGVCLNFSDMLTDLMNEFDYGAATVINRVNKGGTRSYKVDIKRKIQKEKFSSKLTSPLVIPLTKIVGNHAYNLISEKGKLYIYDSTNLTLSTLNSKWESSIVAGKGTSDIKPFFSYSVNESSKAIETLDLLHETSGFESPYSKKDFIITWEECLDFFNNNKYLFDDFHDEIVNNITAISENNRNAKAIIKEYKKK